MLLSRLSAPASNISRVTLRHTFPRPSNISFFSASATMTQNSYKLKIDSLDLQDGDKKEVEVEGIEKGKVLLVKINGKVHAMSPNCTHYGAPLIKGVVSNTGEGRLTCAWHGACFNIASGDVEDAPALDPLAKFPIEERDGGVWIKGDEETIKASRTKANVSCKVQGTDKVVIIGG